MPSLNDMAAALPDDMTADGYEIFSPYETTPNNRAGIEVGPDGRERMRLVVWDRWEDEEFYTPFATGYVTVKGEPRADTLATAAGLRVLVAQARAVLADPDEARAYQAAIVAAHRVGDWREREGLFGG